MADAPKQPVKRRPLSFAEPVRAGQGPENRAAPRHQVSRIVSCRLIRLPKHLDMEARLHDVSLTGVGVYAPAYLDAGTFLAITIQGWQGAQRTLRAKVVHARQVEKGCWLLGCSLDTPLTWPEVEDLL
jgi:hypothetical protein